MGSKFEVPDNEVVIARARKGDLEALETLYRTFEIPVFNMARRLCGTSGEAEDVVQDTFMEVIRSIAKFRGEAPIWAWIRSIATSKALMRLRGGRGRHLEDPLDEEILPDGKPPRAGDVTWGAWLPESKDLEKALVKLPPLTRAVVWLHDVEGYTHDEIAELMGRTASFSKSRLARAHERLRAELAPLEKEEACTQQ